MSRDETEGHDPLTHDALHAQGNLVLIGALHHHTAATGLQHCSVVQPHAIGLGQAGLLIRINRAHMQPWIAPTQDLQQILLPFALLVLSVIEIRQLHILAEALHHFHGLPGGSKDLFTGEVEVHVTSDQAGVG